jgi:hypothetical protein
MDNLLDFEYFLFTFVLCVREMRKKQNRIGSSREDLD